MAEQTSAGATIDTPGQGVAPSPPAAPPPSAPVEQRPIESLSPAERKTWRETGKVPSATPPPENDDAPAIDTQGQPLKDATGQPISKRQQKLNAAIQRGIESATAADKAELKRLQDEIARLSGAQPKPAAPAPDPNAPKPPKQWTGLEPEPKEDDYDPANYPNAADPYKAAIAAFMRDYRQWSEAASGAQATVHRQARTIFETYQGREAAFKATVPDFDAKTATVRGQLNFASPLSLAVIQSEVAPQLILHLAEHPEDFERLGQLGLRDMPKALLALGKLEAHYEATRSTQAAAPVEPVPPKTDSAAPPPNPTLGSRPADSQADPATAAFVRGDFSTGRRLRNQQLIAQREGRA